MFHSSTLTTLGAGSRAAAALFAWFTEESAAEKHMPQLQHNMVVTGTRTAYLSILTGGGKWVSIEVKPTQTVLEQVERIFWRCVQTGEIPRVFGAEPLGRSCRSYALSIWGPLMPGPNTRPSLRAPGPLMPSMRPPKQSLKRSSPTTPAKPLGMGSGPSARGPVRSLLS